ncbi:hypothetical protein E4U55_000084, partial [Claviceps digitariae]
ILSVRYRSNLRIMLGVAHYFDFQSCSGCHSHLRLWFCIHGWLDHHGHDHGNGTDAQAKDL